MPKTVLPIDADFDVEFVDALARQETFNKHHYRPNSYLHKWWARRCGTTFRAILKALVDEPELRGFYTAGGLSGKIILDPMMGGSTTLHEAIRLGANVIGADIDPLPVLQARATLSTVPLDELTTAFESLHDQLEDTLRDAFATTCPTCNEAGMQRFTLYGQRKQCRCGEVVTVDSLTLRRNPDGTRLHLHPISHHILHDEVVVSESTWCELRVVEKSEKRCANCRETYREVLDEPFYQRFVPLAIFGRCSQHGHFFKAPSHSERQQIKSANSQREGLNPAEFPITYGPKARNLLRRRIDSYLDLFTGRQLQYTLAARSALQNFDPLIRLNLGLLVSTSLEFNSLLCGYKGASARRAGAIKHAFARHGYTIPNTALENNPIYGANRSGTLQKLFQSRIVHGRQWAVAPVERRLTADKIEAVPIVGEVDQGIEVALSELHGERRFVLMQGSSAELDLPNNSVDYVITDPPYYDSVQYGDLSEFFHVWLRQFLPDAANWHYAQQHTAVNHHNTGTQFETVLTRIFQECRRVLKPTGRLIFTFHHWKPRAWAELTLALKQAGFVLINRYVVQSESTTSVHTVNQKALLHDVIFVMGSPDDSPTIGWEMPDHLNKADSRTFCKQCGALLGHLLNHRADDLTVDRTWQTMLLS